MATFQEYEIKTNETNKQTIKINFLAANENETAKEINLLKLIPEKIYERINKQEVIDLSNCYIKNFSMKDYRQKYKIASEELISIKLISAEDAFFDNDNDKIIDFSFCKFEGSDLKFNSVIFTQEVRFNSCRFGDFNTSFEYALFYNGNANFEQTKFGEGDTSFKNTKFGEGIKNFTGAYFGAGNVIFINTFFNNGEALFSNTNYYNGRVSFKVAQFGKGKVDFHNAKFGDGDVSFEMTEFGKGTVNFRSSVFGEGKVDFTRAIFQNGAKNFNNIDFGKGTVAFVNTEFGDGKVSFKLSNFSGGKIDLHYSTFGKGDITFERAIFGNGIVDFKTIDFGEGRISFYKSEFGNGNIDFEGCLLNGRMELKHTTFGSGNINMNNVEFDNSELTFENVNFTNDSVTFYNSKFKLLQFENCQLNNYFNFQVVLCNKLDLSNTIIRDIVDMSSTKKNVQINYLDLSGVRLLGRLYINWERNNVKQLIYKQEHSLREKSEQFRLLKENYNAQGLYNDEDNAYVEFKRTELKAKVSEAIEKKPISKLWQYPFYAFQWLVFDKIGLYATNPIRVFLSMIFIYFSFVVVYITLSLLNLGHIIYGIGDEHVLLTVAKCFYFSAVTFLTIGYGDFYPVGYNRFLAGFEGFIGLFLMSYFTVAFVRKILR